LDLTSRRPCPRGPHGRRRRYELRHRIGSAGDGEVYRRVDTRMARVVGSRGCRPPSPELRSQAKSVGLFTRRQQALSRVKDENVVDVLEKFGIIAEMTGTPYMVMGS